MAAMQLPALTYQPGDNFRVSILAYRKSTIGANQGNGDNDGNDDTDAERPDTPSIPVHPIPSMQAAFAESLEEVTHRGSPEKPKLRELDAKGRREKLLDQSSNARPWDALWRYRPGQAQHEVLKLISQISFGVDLLLGGMANDNEQVVGILQGHIDEIDEFLEVVLEDLDETANDLTERAANLAAPLSDLPSFEHLLEDRVFRAETLETNERVEHLLSRTELAIKQWDDDVEAGVQGSQDFMAWLQSQTEAEWRVERPELFDVFEAMTGNAEGWQQAFDQMNTKSQDASDVFVELTTTVSEIEKTAGEVSRRNWNRVVPFTSPTGDRSLASSPSLRSGSMYNPHDSVRSGALPVGQPYGIDSIAEDDDWNFPLPGSLPLLPPNSRSLNRGGSSKESVASHPEIRRSDPVEDNTLFILQPRTYTPQPQAPLPSPRLQNSGARSPLSPQSPRSMHSFGDYRHSGRYSNPKQPTPDEILIGARTFGTELHQPTSPVFSSPRTSHSVTRNSLNQRRSDLELAQPPRQPLRMSSQNDLAPLRPPLRPSPNSDFLRQPYSPSSPAMPAQRPHTAVGGVGTQRGSEFFPMPQSRDIASRHGGASIVNNNAMHAPPSSRPITPMTSGGGKALKKKKSAFGWLKKAFTMDEEERLAFEQRRVVQSPATFFENQQPKWLDGRRIR